MRRNSGIVTLGAVLFAVLILGSVLLCGAFWLGTLAHH